MEGIDTWHKVILSSNIAFGISLDRDTVPVTGISNIAAGDVAQFAAHGYVCKLISTGKRTETGYSAYVQPTLCPAGEPEAAVPSNYNLITFYGETSGRMSFYGQGAGRYPTAYNVVQDCVDLLQGKGFYSVYGGKVAAVNDTAVSYYLRAPQKDWPAADTADTWGDGVITKPVAVDTMHAWLKAHPGAFAAALPIQ